jgi:hypothetical protein
MDQNQNGTIGNINLKCSTHIQGLAYIFIKTLHIVKIVNEKFLAILTFGFFCILFNDYTLRWNDEYIDDYCTKVVYNVLTYNQ